MSAAVLTAPRVVVPPPAPSSLDADLIRLCAEGVALAVERDRKDPARSDDEHDAIVGRLDEMAPAIRALPAVTDEGLRAKAAFVTAFSAYEDRNDMPEEYATALNLAEDALRPRPVLVLPAVAETPIGTIAARVYQLWQEADGFDFGAINRTQVGEEAADEAMRQRHFKALELMDDAMERPASSLGDVVALLDFAISEANGLEAICQNDHDADVRLRAIKRVLHGAGRMVALAVGVPLDGLLNVQPQMDRVLFPGVVMPVWNAVPSSEPEPSDVAEIDRRAAAARASLGAVNTHPATNERWAEFDALCKQELDAFLAVPSVPVQTMAGAQRIAAFLMERQRREPDGFNHGPVENAALRLLENLAGDAGTNSDPDAGLRDQCYRFEALIREEEALIDGNQMEAVGPDAPLVREQKALIASILATVPVTLAGHQARAHAFVGWMGGINADGELDFDLNNEVWPILRDLAGVTPPPRAPSPDEPLIAVCAAFDDLERQRNATFTEEDKTPEEEAAAEALRDRLGEAQEPIFDQILALPATTLAGIRAKVRTLTIENAEILKDGTGDRSTCLLASVCRDVLASASRTDRPSPDAAVLTLCDEALAAWKQYDRANVEEGDDAATTLFRRAHSAFDRIMASDPPTTAAGIAAVAKVALVTTSSASSEAPLDIDVNHKGERLAWRIVQLVAGVPADRVQDVGDEA